MGTCLEQVEAETQRKVRLDSEQSQALCRVSYRDRAMSISNCLIIRLGKGVNAARQGGRKDTQL